jgi:hypothetical protein
MSAKRFRWADMPLRRCYSMHHCASCDRTIELGQLYRDRHGRKRVHEACGRRLDRIWNNADALAAMRARLQTRSPK